MCRTRKEDMIFMHSNTQAAARNVGTNNDCLRAAEKEDEDEVEAKEKERVAEDKGEPRLVDDDEELVESKADEDEDEDEEVGELESDAIVRSLSHNQVTIIKSPATRMTSPP